ncbi:hypothetical protein T07_10648 [Trichinella nelsoni]|uniref:Uncharacterized protein n=1 Tax=Trichinella nelsoni TaxID=6336 RepID=A0A0V0SEU3_9BILA|nr:hypothetical protein T07_10648 [Trichinella nelsoni]
MTVKSVKSYNDQSVKKVYAILFSPKSDDFQYYTSAYLLIAQKYHFLLKKSNLLYIVPMKQSYHLLLTIPFVTSLPLPA